MAEWRIFVLSHGWVLAGDVDTYNDGEGVDVVLSRGYTIRRWGTEKGIGELANGPLLSTVADAIDGDIRFSKSSVVFSFACKGWK